MMRPKTILPARTACGQFDFASQAPARAVVDKVDAAEAPATPDGTV